MRTKMARRAAAALLAAALAPAVPAGADPAGAMDGPAMNHGADAPPPGGASWRDSLTGDQRTEIDLARLKLGQKQSVLQAQIGLKRAEINRLITSEDTDQDTLQGRVDELAALEREKLTNYYRHLLEVRQLLTPKQRVAFDLDILSPSHHSGPGHAHE